jgi:hypothetical protein
MSRPQLSAVREPLKPTVWFAPMWANTCGPVSAVVMAALPVVAIALRAKGGQLSHALGVAALFGGQCALMELLLRDPPGRAAFCKATGKTLRVPGMLVSANALRAG